MNIFRINSTVITLFWLLKLKRFKIRVIIPYRKMRIRHGGKRSNTWIMNKKYNLNIPILNAM